MPEGGVTRKGRCVTGHLSSVRQGCQLSFTYWPAQTASPFMTSHAALGYHSTIKPVRDPRTPL